MDQAAHRSDETPRSGQPLGGQPLGGPRLAASSTSHQQQRSIGELIGDLGRDLSRLVSDEIKLARAEVGESANSAITALISIGAGIAFALAALVILLQAIVVALDNVMATWLAAVIVGVVAAAIGFVMVATGQKMLKPENLAPTRTGRNLKRDTEILAHAGPRTDKEHL